MAIYLKFCLGSHDWGSVAHIQTAVISIAVSGDISTGCFVDYNTSADEADEEGGKSDL